MISLSKLALNEGTFPRSDNWRAKLQACRAAGFRAVGLCIDRLESYVRAGESPDSIHEILCELELRVAEVNYLREWMGECALHGNRLVARVRQALRWAEVLQCDTVTAACLERDVDWRVASANLKLIADMAAEKNITIAVEFLPWAAARTLTDVSRVLNDAKASNVGILVDTFHFFAAGHTTDELRKLDPAQIALVHINDLPEQTRHHSLILQTRRERVFPGEGCFPISPFLSALHDIGYNGYVSVEVFPSRHSTLDLLELARRAYTTTSQRVIHVDE
jgi:2-keto-myo-inositol isomerase